MLAKSRSPGECEQHSPGLTALVPRPQGRLCPRPLPAPLLGFGSRVGVPRRPGSNTLVSTSQPTPGLLGVPYLPSPARSCMVWVRVATGEEVAARSGDPRRP